MLLPGLLESAMLVAFGAAWPANIIKSLKSRTAKGKSLAFLCREFETAGDFHTEPRHCAA